jgi:hypothetical protein
MVVKDGNDGYRILRQTSKIFEYPRIPIIIRHTQLICEASLLRDSHSYGGPISQLMGAISVLSLSEFNTRPTAPRVVDSGYQENLTYLKSLPQLLVAMPHLCRLHVVWCFHTSFSLCGMLIKYWQCHSQNHGQWPFQEPKLAVPTIYMAFFHA